MVNSNRNIFLPPTRHSRRGVGLGAPWLSPGSRQGGNGYSGWNQEWESCCPRLRELVIA